MSKEDIFLNDLDQVDSWLDSTSFAVQEAEKEQTLERMSGAQIKEELIAGNDGEVQFNDDGDAGADSNFTWDNTDKILNIPAIQFDLTPTQTNAEGKVFWDVDNGTLCLGMPGGDVALQIGQELYAPRSKAVGSDIDNGQLVYISGATGAVPEMALAKADTSATSRGVIAMSTENITQNQLGYYTSFGLVREVDTSGYSEGDALYLSAATAGGYTNVKPSQPNFIVKIGIVIRAHATEGIIFVTINQRTNNYTHIQGLTSGSVVFANSDGFLDQDNANFHWDNTNKRLGIGTTTPSESLEVDGCVSILLDTERYKIAGFDVLGINVANSNTYVGRDSGKTATGIQNTFIGELSGYISSSLNTGNFNTFVGARTGFRNTTGSENTFVGRWAGMNNTTGGNNTFLGYQAGQANTTGLRNFFLGRSAGFRNTIGNDNLLLGYLSGLSLVDGNNNIIIGSSIDVPASDSDDYLNIGDAVYGDLSSGNIGVGVTNPAEKLHVGGDARIDGLTASKPVWTDANKTLISKDITACDVVKTRLTASAQTVNTGTLSSGTVTDVQTWSDGNEVNISEVAGTPGYDVEYRIDNVADFCEIVIAFYYVGSSTHDCQVQIYDDANTTWRGFINQTGAQLGHNTRYAILPDDSANYINSSDQVKIRFYHPKSGNASHDLYIDYVAIIGAST